MNNDWLAALDGPEYKWHARQPGVSDEEVAALSERIARPLPKDYETFLRYYGGGDLWYEDIWCVVLWHPREIPAVSDGYGFTAGMPGALTFGSDGGGEGLVFDVRREQQGGQLPVLAVNYVTIGWDEAIHVADSFRDLLLLQHPLLKRAT